jgi:NADH dehydrogenase
MTHVVVLGAGYAGSGAITSLESELDDGADLTWISREDYHLVLHETHRVIRNPDMRDTITISVDEIKSDDTQFIQGEVTDIAVDDREIELDDGSTIEYDYAIICLGTQTAFYGIDGMEEHALTLKSLGDALSINQHIQDAANEASQTDPAQIVVGGAGLTGIQTAGEVAAFRDENDASMDIHLVEMEENIFPGHDPEFQGGIENQLEAHDVDVTTDALISEVDDSTVMFEEHDPIEYDVLVWAGGVTGQDALANADLNKDHNRVHADSTLMSNNDRVFCLGDSSLIDQDEETETLSEQVIWEAIVDPDVESPPPPTAEAAMEAGEILGQNVARKLDNRDMVHWTYTNKGTLVSIGDAAVAHDVIGIPINTFAGHPARIIKKGISARWIGKISSWKRAIRAWPHM